MATAQHVGSPEARPHAPAVGKPALLQVVVEHVRIAHVIGVKPLLPTPSGEC